MKLIKTNNYIFLFSIGFVVFSISYSSDKNIPKSKGIRFGSTSVFENPHPHWKEWEKAKQWQTISHNKNIPTRESQNFLINILLQLSLSRTEKRQLKSLATFIDHEPDVVNFLLNQYRSKYRKELQQYYNQY